MVTDFLRIITPFLLASLGGLYTEYNGTTNVAIEGYTTLGAFLVIALTKVLGNLYLGIALTIIIIATLSFLHSFFTIKLKANPIITGLAVNMGFFGFISVLSFRIFETKGLILLNINDPINTKLLTILAIVFPAATFIFIKYSRYGLRLRANGINKKLLSYSNISSNYYNISSMMISGVLSSLAGIFLALELRGFIPNISSGRGWIALVIVFLGRKNPFGIVIGCSIFTIALTVSNMSQSQIIPSDLVLSIPYILTLVALILSHWKLKKAS